MPDPGLEETKLPQGPKMPRSTPMASKTFGSVETEDKRLFATSAYEGLVVRVCPVVIVVEFGVGNTVHTKGAERKNTSVEIRHFETVVAEIVSDLKMMEKMLFAEM
jgi:hypothetical protein